MSAGNFSRSGDPAPQITFAVACFNAQPYLGPAIRSALAQAGVSVEVIIVDDGSSDNSLAEAREIASTDARVRVFQTVKNGGPAVARNIALDKMKGDWFAVLDSDDLLDPDRSKKLLAAADQHGADLIADNLLVFGESEQKHSFYDRGVFCGGRWLKIDEYFERSQLFGNSPEPGFLKPMIRRSVIERFGLRYNPTLRIGEDDELIVRLLNDDCGYFVLSEPMYHYRKHTRSISHRLSAENAQGMLEAEKNIRTIIGPDRSHSKAYQKRFNSIERGLAFVKSIEQIKEGELLAALATLCRKPSAIALYRMPLIAAANRIIGKN